MKRILFISLVLVVMVGVVGLAEDYDVRSVSWGMSPEEVIEQELKHYDNEVFSFGEYLLGRGHYKTKLEELSEDGYIIIYFFEDDKLHNMVFTNSDDESVSVKLSKYLIMKEDLKRRYNGIENKDIWRSKTFKNDFLRWVDALNRGEVIFISEFEDERTHCQLILGEVGGNVNLIINYYDIEKID